MNLNDTKTNLADEQIWANLNESLAQHELFMRLSCALETTYSEQEQVTSTTTCSFSSLFDRATLVNPVSMMHSLRRPQWFAQDVKSSASEGRESIAMLRPRKEIFDRMCLQVLQFSWWTAWSDMHRFGHDAERLDIKCKLLHALCRPTPSI